MKKNIFFLLVGVALMGFSPILAKISGENGLIVSFYRLTLSLFLLLPVLLKKNTKIILSNKCAIQAGAMFALNLILFYTSLEFTNPASASFLASTFIFWITLYAFVKKKSSKFIFWTWGVSSSYRELLN